MNQQNVQWTKIQVRQTIGALGIFLSVLILQIFAAVITLALSKVTGITPNSPNYVMFVSMLSAFMAAVWSGYWYWRSDWRKRDFSYRNALQLRQLIALISVAVGGCVFISITLTIWQTIFPGEFQQYSNVMSNFSTSSPWLTYCYVLLIGPISEELIFRGAILDRLYLAFPFWAANLLQALLFGIYHMNLVQGIYAFVLGAVLGLVRVSTGTIFASIGTHIIFNATSYVLQLVFPSGQKISIVIFAGVYLLATLLFADGLWWKIIIEGAMLGMFTLLAFSIGNRLYSVEVGRTMAFLTLGILELVHSFNIKSEESIFKIGVLENKYLVGALVLGVILQVIVVVVSPLAQVFSLVPLTGMQWLYTILIAVAPIPIVEIQKAVNGYKFGRVVYAKNN